MKYDLDILNDYVERGLLEVGCHPYLPLTIWNYSRFCAFSKAWDDITLNMRGTILDESGYVIASGFPKFFNMEELSTIPNEPFEVFEKMDGSLGIAFFYANEWHMATRGSFTSTQAIKGRELLNKYDIDKLSPGYTYLFEIIYPENRVVVSYGNEEKLVLLAILDCSMDRIEVNIHRPYYLESFDVVRKYDGVQDFSKLKNMVDNNAEGFVIRFSSGMRMKIKGEEYVRLHRLLTNFSNVDIWEVLKSDKDLTEFLERVPDEFDEWVRSVEIELKSKYAEIVYNALKLYSEISFNLFQNNRSFFDRRNFAECVNNTVEKPMRGFMFRLFDGKPIDEMAWNMVRPVYQKPFWQKQSEID